MELQWEIRSQDGQVFQGTDRMPSASERARAHKLIVKVPHKLLPYKVTVPQGGALIFFIRHRQQIDINTMNVVRKEHEFWIGSRVGTRKDVRCVRQGFFTRATRHDDDGRLIPLRREGVCNRCGECCVGCDNHIPPNICAVWESQSLDKGCRVWPPHPFEKPPSCSYSFCDAETGELVEGYKDWASLKAYGGV